MKRLLPALLLLLATPSHAMIVTCSQAVNEGSSILRRDLFLQWNSEQAFTAAYTTQRTGGGRTEVIKEIGIVPSEHSLHCELDATNGALLDCMGGNPRYPVFARLDPGPGGTVALSMQTIHGSTYVVYNAGECQIRK